jgi:Fe-Mn family superoxide dismutase
MKEILNEEMENIFQLTDYAQWEPYINRDLVKYHYELHHLQYVKNLKNQNIFSFEHVMNNMQNYTQSQINNALQIHNHNIFWHSMKIHNWENKMDLPLKEFELAANSVFGSGWVWLVQDRQDYHIIPMITKDAQIPDTTKYQILLTLDLWEHAYYLQYYANRKEFINVFVNHLINYEYIEKNLMK